MDRKPPDVAQPRLPSVTRCGGMLNALWEQSGMTDYLPTIRYIVDDVTESLGFYIRQLRFSNWVQPNSRSPMVTSCGTRLLLSADAAETTEGMHCAAVPSPGGWNRIQLPPQNLLRTAEAMERAGVSFRGKIIAGVDGRQLLIEDPSGNLIELLELRTW